MTVRYSFDFGTIHARANAVESMNSHHDPGDRYNVVLTNPPFGKRSSHKVIGEDGKVETEREDYEREDCKFTTSNKQLDFLQHIMSIMDTGGAPPSCCRDNVLLEAGSAWERIRKRLFRQFNLRSCVPTGIIYKPGAMANVLFFEKYPPRSDDNPNTKELWIYDFVSNPHFTLKKDPLKRNLSLFSDAEGRNSANR